MKKTIAILLVLIFSMSLITAESLSSKESLTKTVLLMVAMQKTFIETVVEFCDAKTDQDIKDVMTKINGLKKIYSALNEVIKENNNNPEYYTVFSNLGKAADSMALCIEHFNNAVENLDYDSIALVEKELDNYMDYIKRACVEIEKI